MATTKVSGEVVDLRGGLPDYSLAATNTVSYLNAGGGNQYNFNGAYGLYGVVNGTYVLSSVSSSHPIAILNNGKTSLISYTGAVNEGSQTGPDGNTYTYYSGDVTITVSGNFDVVSYACKIHGYMGGQNNLIYTNLHSELGLKIPTGTNNNRPATDVAGMIRNNTNETSDSSASCEEYYNGTAWKKINNVAIPVYYRAVLYTGNSSTQAITGVGFKPDFVWIKERAAAENHYVQDSTRGSTQQLYTNQNASQFNETTAVTSFDSDGFTMGSYSGVNNNGDTYVAYCWQANGGTTSSNTDGTNTSTVQVNSAAGFSIVQATASGGYPTFNSFGHGLGTTPGLIILKQMIGNVAAWVVWHKDYANTSQDFMNLNSTGGLQTSQYVWGNQAPTSSLFSLTDGWTVNVNGQFIAYCFSEVVDFSKFGSFTGNGTAGQTITVGFELTWLLMKSTVGTDNWRLYDTTRGIMNGYFEPNNSDAERTTNAPNITVTATGFEITSGGVTEGLNANGNLVIYAAFK